MENIDYKYYDYFMEDVTKMEKETNTQSNRNALHEKIKEKYYTNEKFRNTLKDLYDRQK